MNGPDTPLADRLRPASLDEVVGQDHLVGPDGRLRRLLGQGVVRSSILWGPPGTGKTTIARLLAQQSGLEWAVLSAVNSGTAELRKLFAQAAQRRAEGRGTLLFIDELHRFNRAQQDALLPVVEDGTIVLVGATTENPGFEINAALLSRTEVLVLKPLDSGAMQRLLERAEAHLGQPLPLTAEARRRLIEWADGDGRALLNLVESLWLQIDKAERIDETALARLVQRKPFAHDRSADARYDLISALHKSLRASDVDAAVYWFERMLAGGEDPLYVGRRLIRFASEDIGLADPDALPQAIAAVEAWERLGSPEGDLALMQAVVYLATSPKSNALYRAQKAARQIIERTGSLPPPAHLLNAPTRLARQLGRGQGYRYDHDLPNAFSGQDCFPEDLPRHSFYDPPERGFEREIRRRLLWWARQRRKNQS
ncbi:MAG: replication-associated recombination protein A [Wenzhouxiangellaceae bacterium]